MHPRFASRSKVLARLMGVTLLLVSSTLSAQAAGEIQASAGWIRFLPGQLPMAAYVRLHKAGTTLVQLQGASSPAFKNIMLHRSVTENGQTRMLPLDSLEIAPDTTVEFAPGGLHLMLMGRNQALKVGDRVPITLHFSDDSNLKVEFLIKGVGGQ